MPHGTNESAIRNALRRLGVTQIKGVIRQVPQNDYVVVFYDLREEMLSAARLEGKTISGLNGNGVRLAPVNGLFGSLIEGQEKDTPLEVQFIEKRTVEKVRLHVYGWLVTMT